MTAFVPSSGGADGAVGDSYGCDAFLVRGDHVVGGGDLYRYLRSFVEAVAPSSSASPSTGATSYTLYASREPGVVAYVVAVSLVQQSQPRQRQSLLPIARGQTIALINGLLLHHPCRELDVVEKAVFRK